MTRYLLALIPAAILAVVMALGFAFRPKPQPVEPAGTRLMVNGKPLQTTDGFATAPIEGGFVVAQADFAEDLGAPSLRWGDEIKGVYLNVSELRPEFRLSLAGTGEIRIKAGRNEYVLHVTAAGVHLADSHGAVNQTVSEPNGVAIVGDGNVVEVK